MGLFDKFKAAMERNRQAMERQKELMRAEEAGFKVKGLFYHMENVEAIGQPNPDYKKSKSALIKEGKTETKIYKTVYGTPLCELVREPDNEHDKNAIRVEVDHRLIGYISKRQNKALLKIMDEKKILTSDVMIVGGPYKMIGADGSSYSDKTDHWARVKIKYI